MVKLDRLLKVLICCSIFSAMIGCATAQKHESAGEYVDDSVVTTKVKAAILDEPTLKTMQINVKTYKGVVQLSGFVDTPQEIQRAGEVASRVTGVKEVKNDLTVKR